MSALQSMYFACAGGSAVPTGPMFTGDPYFGVDAAGFPPSEIYLELQADGDIWIRRLNLPDSLVGSWDNGQGGILDANDYDFRFDITSGGLSYGPSDPAGTWINGGGLAWGLRENGFGIENVSGTLRMRPAGGGVDIDVAAVSLNAETV